MVFRLYVICNLIVQRPRMVLLGCTIKKQKSFAVKSHTLHLISAAPAEAIGPAIHERKEGEQHAEDLGLMDALRGGARAHLLNE